MNLKIAKIRQQTLENVRNFFALKNFLEVQTPTLVNLPGMEPNLDPLSVNIPINNKKNRGYLITSPEYHMKRLLSSGFQKIWQLSSSFRGNEEKSPLHAVEFKMLEYYAAGMDYNKMADFTEELVKEMVLSKKKSLHTYQECKIEKEKPFEKITCKQAFKKYCNLNLDALYKNKSEFIGSAKKYDLNPSQSTEDIFWIIFLQDIEPHLGKKRPTFLFDYPAEMAALSKIKENNRLYCERFELYISGIEIANAFTELTDPKEQLDRLEKEKRERVNSNKEVYEIDKEFIKALELGMPESSGVALGFDRLVMIAAQKESIHEVMFFSKELIEMK